MYNIKDSAVILQSNKQNGQLLLIISNNTTLSLTLDTSSNLKQTTLSDKNLTIHVVDTHINVKVNNMDDPISEISLIHISGKNKLHKYVNEFEYVINTSHHKIGVYVLRIYQKSGRVTTKKIFIR